MTARFFQQMKCADDIGLNEIFRSVYRTIDMRLGREIDDGAGAILSQQFFDQYRIANIALYKNMTRIAMKTGEIFQIARVGELVQIENRFIIIFQPVQHKICADKTRTTGNEYHC